jgi:hypothetical protein
VYDEKKTDSDGGTGSIDSLIKSLETGDAGGLPMLRPGDASKYIYQFRISLSFDFVWCDFSSR